MNGEEDEKGIGQGDMRKTTAGRRGEKEGGKEKGKREGK